MIFRTPAEDAAESPVQTGLKRRFPQAETEETTEIEYSVARIGSVD